MVRVAGIGVVVGVMGVESVFVVVVIVVVIRSVVGGGGGRY